MENISESNQDYSGDSRKTNYSRVIVIIIVALVGFIYFSSDSENSGEVKNPKSTNFSGLSDSSSVDSGNSANSTPAITGNNSSQTLEQSDESFLEDSVMSGNTVSYENYKIYSGGGLDQYLSKLKKDSRLVLFFYAGRCPSCQALDEDIIKNREAIPSNMLIVKIDYDSYKDLVKKYNVKIQNTVVYLDKSGKETFSISMGIVKLSTIKAYSR